MSDEARTRILAEYRYKRERLPYRKETTTLVTPPIIAGLVPWEVGRSVTRRGYRPRDRFTIQA